MAQVFFFLFFVSGGSWDVGPQLFQKDLKIKKYNDTDKGFLLEPIL